MKRYFLFKMKNTLTIISLLSFLVPSSVFSQGLDPDFAWVINAGGSGWDGINDVASDALGNSVVVGSFENLMIIGSNSLTSTGGSDMFLAKYNSSGAPIWARSGGGSNNDNGVSVAVDPNGDIIIAGSFSGRMILGTFDLISSGNDDIFIIKYSSDGQLIWAKRAGGQDYDYPTKIISDKLGNIYVTGSFTSFASFDNINISGNTFPNVFIAKYNSSGDAQWVKTGIGNSFYSIGNGLAVDNNNDVFLTGSYESLINFDGTQISGTNTADIYLIKFNSAGIVQWFLSGNGLGWEDRGRDIAIDKNNNIYMTGSFSETITFNQSNYTSQYPVSIFVLKISPTGLPLSFVQDGLTGSDNSGARITLDDAGNPAVISIVSQAGSGGEVNDLYVSRYSTDGQKIWGLPFGSTGSDFAGGISTDSNSDIIVTGTFSNQGNFGTKFLTSNGQQDGFIGKIPVPKTSFNNIIFNFGTTAIGTTVTRNLIISNATDTRLHLYGSSVIGTNVEEFSLETLPSSIAPAQSDTFTISYAPNGTGLHEAKLLIISDAPTSPDTVFLSGQAGAISISLSTNLIDYGSVDTSGSSDRTLTITNNGTGDAVVLLPVILGINQNDFSIVDLTSYPDTLLPEEVKNISIRFSPNATGNRSAQLQIISNAPSSPDIVDLQGIGIEALIEITLSTNSLDFGTVDINNFSEQTLTVTNTGTQNVMIDSASIVPVSQTDFSVVNTQFPISLLPEEIANISIRFSPTTPGDKLSGLQINSNVPGSPDLVELEGIAVTGITFQLPAPPQIGQNVSLNILPPAGFLATSGEIFYRQTGEQIYTRTLLTQQDTSFPAEIPPQFSTIKGIQFYIVFTGATGSVTYPTTNPINQPAFLQVNIPVFPFQGTIPTAEYRMVSIPVSVNNPDILSVFSDDYGQYDSTMWRIFRWNNILDAYDEFPESDLTPGNAFWLIHREGKTFDIENAMSVQSSNDFIITLQANSWTQIGNPFAFEVDFNPGLEIDSLYLYRWNIDSLEYEMNQTILEPWDGYFVRNDNDIPVILSIPPIRSIIEKQIPKIVTFSGGEFVVQIKTNVEGSRYKDNQNYVGMISDKKNIYAANLLEPPPITNDIRLSIVEDNKYFAQNTISVNSDGSSWNLQLSTSHRNKNIQFNFDYLNTLPAGFNIYLLNVDRQVAIPIHNNSADIKITNEDKINLKLIIGTEQFAKNNSDNISLAPTEYMLSQNYPNPFNPSTSIVYNLREKSVVTIEVFDILGRKIKSLVSDEQKNSGLHTAVWNGLNTNGDYVSSGIYIYRIRANDFIDSKKMMLLK